MSPSRNLGFSGMSEEIHALMNKLSSEEGQNAAKQDRLVRQAAEIQKLDNALHETIYKPQPLSSIPASMSLSVLEPNTDVITYIERLLNTVDRLRGERDSLRRDVEFLEFESRFTIEALEAKLSASISTANDKTVTTISQQNVQEELNNTTLQSHPPSNTDSEATRNLREQIEELENRVMRRTEQIGIHQHDIKRLETNLRLQEERLSEMTTELEMMAAQKDAMVEDCAAAREARDDALIRVERLEEELESSDGRNDKRLETNLRLQEERLSEMTAELEMMAAQKNAMVDDCAAAREARDKALIRVERLEEELESSEGRNVDNTVVVESLIATIAHTVCQARETIRLSKEEYISSQNAHQRTIQEANSSNLELEKRLGAATEKLAELELLCGQYDELKKEHAKQQSRLQEELAGISHSYQDLERSRDTLRDENVRLTEDLICNQKEHATQIDRCREESRTIEQELEQQIASLQGQIEEQQFGAATEKLAELELLREQYDDLKKEHANQESRLQEELARISHSYQDLERSRNALQDDKVRLTEDLTRIQKEHATQIDRCREENRAIERELEQQIVSLQCQVEEQQLGASTEKSAELELLREQYDDVKKEQSRLQEELTSMSHNYQDLERSRDALQDEKLRLTEDLTRIRKEHATQIDRCREESRVIERELEQQIASLQCQIEEQQLGAATEKSAELELLREQYDNLKNEHANQESRLQEELARISHNYQDLEHSRDALQEEKIHLVEDLTRIQKEHATQIDRCREESRAIERELEQQIVSLQCQIEEQQLGAATEKSAELELLREQYDDLKKEHSNQESRLQEELTRISHNYQDLERARDALQDDKVHLSDDLTRIQKEHATQIDRCREESRAIEGELEQQIVSLQCQIEEQQFGASTEKLAELELLREQYDNVKKEQSHLQEELTRISHNYQDLERSRDALQDDKVRLTEDLTRIQKEHATQIDRCEESRAIERELEQRVTSLQGQIEEKGRLLDISEREVTRIRNRLQEEVEGRAQDKNQHAMALLSEKEHNEDAYRTISQLRGELEMLDRNLQQTNVHLQTVEDEKLTVRQQMTELEAEVQRSKSLIQYLEIQIKDSDQLVSTLKGDIERTKADLARSENSWKTAEVNLSLQNAQRKREMTELERELSAFRSMPSLEQALAELEECNIRNSEMEGLLRKKCVEIEENDDRALEMLKEKKKLTIKVESLTRKVQNLQAKLEAARTSRPPESQSTVPASLPLTSSTPQSTSISSRPRSTTVPSAPPLYPPPIETPSTSTAQNPSNRVVSGPSFLPRPKTPERRTVTPVFKARTPERQMNPEIAPIPPATVIGKKRAAPDDFGAYGSVPAQAFTADGEDVENKIPRERKVLNSLQSGSRPIAPSPRRGAPSSRTSPFISDLTNSPHHLAQTNPSSEKPSKRGWLGKIRGTSHATDKPQVPSMRPLSLFDSGDRS